MKASNDNKRPRHTPSAFVALPACGLFAAILAVQAAVWLLERRRMIGEEDGRLLVLLSLPLVIAVIGWKVVKGHASLTALLLLKRIDNIHLFDGLACPTLASPQEGAPMTIQLGQVAPDFEQDSTQGKIRFHDWLGDSWGVLFSHPKNFTPVCTTELGEVAKLRPQWEKRNVKPIGLSVDPVEAHHKWERDIEETQGAKLDFPMIADPDAKVSALYDMIHPDSDPTVTVRSVFVIDPKRKVRLILTYPPSTGRNFQEILRAIDSLQLTDARSVATPVNWTQGEPVVISPKMSDEEAARQFPQGYKTLKPYLRIVDLQASAQ